MAGIARKFVLLVWKNLLLRWRHPVLTGMEVVIPILLFVGLFFLTPEPRSDGWTETFPDEIYQAKDERELLSWWYGSGPLLFAPNETEVARNVTKLLRETLGSSKIQTFRTEADLLAFLKLSQLQSGTMMQMDVRGAVVFLGDDEKNLRYKIRTQGYIDTSSLFSPYSYYGYGSYDFQYLNDFIPIELLVNSAWIRAKKSWGPVHLNLSEPIFREAL
ncbi:unnamed protein product, partial [Darwinula stevensoni]